MINMRKEKAAENALEVLERMVSKFPGLIDGDIQVGQSVNLAKVLTDEIGGNEDLNIYLSVFTIDSTITKE